MPGVYRVNECVESGELATVIVQIFVSYSKESGPQTDMNRNHSRGWSRRMMWSSCWVLQPEVTGLLKSPSVSFWWYLPAMVELWLKCLLTHGFQLPCSSYTYHILPPHKGGPTSETGYSISCEVWEHTSIQPQEPMMTSRENSGSCMSHWVNDGCSCLLPFNSATAQLPLTHAHFISIYILFPSTT